MNDLNGNGRNPTPSIPFDAWAVLDFWRRRWYWLAAWTILLAIAGGFIAHGIWQTSYTATAQLIHYQPSAVDDTYHPRDIQAPSLVLMLQSPQFMERVGSELQPRESAQQLAKRVTLNLDRYNDLADVSVTGKDLNETVALANRFTADAIAATKQMQHDEAVDSEQRVKGELANLAIAQTAAEADPLAKSPGTQQAKARLGAAPAPADDINLQIEHAQEHLDELLLQYTDAHPQVQEQKARVEYLKKLKQQRVASGAISSAPAEAAPLPPEFYGKESPKEVALAERLREIEAHRATLEGRERALLPFKENPPGYFQLSMPASPQRTYEHRHRLEIVLFAFLGAFLGLIGAAGQILLGEFLDNRLKTRTDVRRVTGLPLIATLGDLGRLNAVERDQWAFRTWTSLQSRLSISPNHGMVCGITSAHPGDGRSTWIELLAKSAEACGFRVLTIRAQPSAEMVNAQAATRPKQRKMLREKATAVAAAPDPIGELPISTNVLSAPSQITDQLAAVDGPPRVNIPLPGWVWNLERRKQWGSALESWRGIDHIVIFVELPPASHPETVLLAENIPNLIWLVDAGKSDAAETHTELETLRDAKCNLVGAVLNRENSAPVRGRFTRWLGSSAFLLPFALALGLAGAPRVHAQEAAPDQFSVQAAAARSEWQKDLTLGPGDVISLHLFGAPELDRPNVTIGPDGRVSYLEAQNVLASGLTVDQLRQHLNDELRKYRRAPQAFVIPVAYRSKHYYVLGAVQLKGSFVLDRPLTVVEAVARARGFETTSTGGTVADAANLAKAFLGRGGKHVPVDFTALFQRGDLSQNVPIEPGDYLYFPSSGGGQVYVLGSVKLPGAAPASADETVLGAIADRGGFLQGAWKNKVLVVRGSLDHPKTFIVNLASLLQGNGSDFALESGDIIYVANRPWFRAEELLDHAASAFVESAVVAWTTIHVDGSGSTASLVSP